MECMHIGYHRWHLFMMHCNRIYLFGWKSYFLRKRRTWFHGRHPQRVGKGNVKVAQVAAAHWTYQQAVKLLWRWRRSRRPRRQQLLQQKPPHGTLESSSTLDKTLLLICYSVFITYVHFVANFTKVMKVVVQGMQLCRGATGPVIFRLHEEDILSSCSHCSRTWCLPYYSERSAGVYSAWKGAKTEQGKEHSINTSRLFIYLIQNMYDMKAFTLLRY